MQAKLDDTQKKLDATNNKLRLAEDDLEKSEERGDAAEDKVRLLLVLLMLLACIYSDTPSRMVAIFATAAPSVDTSLKTLPNSRATLSLDTALHASHLALQAEEMEAELAKVASDFKSLAISHSQATNDQEEDSSKAAEYKAKLDSVSRLGFALPLVTLMAAHPSYLCRPVLPFLVPIS